MKKLILAALALLSVSAFSQSYFILQNGVTLTLDKAGFVYDFGNFNLPYKTKILGGQFFVSDEVLHTVDAKGFIYNKQTKIKELQGKGFNYFINEKHDLVTISTEGYVTKFDKEKIKFKKATVYGGNYFTIVDNKKANLFTVASNGRYFRMVIPGLNPMGIVLAGGNWFMSNGVIYTVNKDGQVFAKKEPKVAGFTRKGGNYFFSNTNKIYTVSEQGFLLLPALPMTFKSSDIVKLGYNYMVDREGRLFVVDASGNVFERQAPNKHDLRTVKSLSL